MALEQGHHGYDTITTALLNLMPHFTIFLFHAFSTIHHCCRSCQKYLGVPNIPDQIPN